MGLIVCKFVCTYVHMHSCAGRQHAQGLSVFEWDVVIAFESGSAPERPCARSSAQTNAQAVGRQGECACETAEARWDGGGDPIEGPMRKPRKNKAAETDPSADDVYSVADSAPLTTTLLQIPVPCFVAALTSRKLRRRLWPRIRRFLRDPDMTARSSFCRARAAATVVRGWRARIWAHLHCHSCHPTVASPCKDGTDVAFVVGQTVECEVSYFLRDEI